MPSTTIFKDTYVSILQHNPQPLPLNVLYDVFRPPPRLYQRVRVSTVNSIFVVHLVYIYIFFFFHFISACLYCTLSLWQINFYQCKPTRWCFFYKFGASPVTAWATHTHVTLTLSGTAPECLSFREMWTSLLANVLKCWRTNTLPEIWQIVIKNEVLTFRKDIIFFFM